MQGSTNHNYAPLNHIIEHVCLNSRLLRALCALVQRLLRTGKIIFCVMTLKAQENLSILCTILQRMFFLEYEFTSLDLNIKHLLSEQTQWMPKHCRHHFRNQ